MTNWMRYKRLWDRLTDIQEIQTIFEIVQKYAGNVSKYFRNIYHSELEKSLYWHKFSKGVTQWADIQENQNHLDLVYIHSRKASKNFQKDISSRTRDISILAQISKEVSKLTDWQRHRKLRIIWIHCKKIPGKPQKNFRMISHPEPKIYLY